VNSHPYTTADLAREFKLAPKTLRKKADALKLGIDRGGRAGFLYSEADRLALIESMRPAKPVEKRRRRRAA
jgi:hypothetical protein